jgi:trk system potassium uptake protein TrkH
MNRRFVTYLLGWLLLLDCAFLCLPLLASLFYRESLEPWVAAIAIGGIIGLLLVRVRPPIDRHIRPRDGFLVVSGAWIAVSLVGSVPYLVTGSLGPVDAFFESVSGFTTTGSTVITDTTLIPRALLLWRAMSQWLGGMGIILFTIAILPLLGIGGMQLFKAEVPGPVADKVKPRLATTARTLWLVYVGFTGAECVALRLAGLSWFDALCHSFATLATGGFSTKNTSVGEFGSATVEWIVIFFMLLAGINFVLHFKFLTGRVVEVWRDSELRYFLGVIAVSTLVLFVTVHEDGNRLGDSLRHAAFQTVSILTTTGYCTTDFETWTTLPLLVLLCLMVLGGMSGSTGGGIKSLRALLALTSLRTTLLRLIHPHAVRPVKYGGVVVRESVLSGIWAFLTAYLMIALVGTAVVAASGYDLLTAISAGLTSIGNVGPGLGEIGAYDNFAHFPGQVKVVLAACMLFGRLEVFTLLALFSREFWRR